MLLPALVIIGLPCFFSFYSKSLICQHVRPYKNTYLFRSIIIIKVNMNNKLSDVIELEIFLFMFSFFSFVFLSFSKAIILHNSHWTTLSRNFNDYVLRLLSNKLLINECILAILQNFIGKMENIASKIIFFFLISSNIIFLARFSFTWTYVTDILLWMFEG